MSARFLAGPLLVVAVVFALSSPSYTQPPNRGGGGGDPKSRFDYQAKGKDYLVISEASMYSRDAMVKFAKDNNITNDKMTFEQYKAYSEQRAKEFGGKKDGGGKKGSGGKGGGGAFDGIRNFFGKDQTKDKSSDTKPAASASRPAEKAPSSPSITSRTVADDELDRRPVVFRAGKLPPGLPDWFEKLDRDKDGQVDLGEWRLAKKEIAEFKKMDLNNDGLLTPDEVLRYQGIADKAQPSEDTTAATVEPKATDAKSDSKDSEDEPEKTDKSPNKDSQKKGSR